MVCVCVVGECVRFCNSLKDFPSIKENKMKRISEFYNSTYEEHNSLYACTNVRVCECVSANEWVSACDILGYFGIYFHYTALCFTFMKSYMTWYFDTRTRRARARDSRSHWAWIVISITAHKISYLNVIYHYEQSAVAVTISCGVFCLFLIIIFCFCFYFLFCFVLLCVYSRYIPYVFILKIVLTIYISMHLRLLLLLFILFLLLLSIHSLLAAMSYSCTWKCDSFGFASFCCCEWE